MKVKDLLRRGKYWTQRANARDAKGCFTTADATNATKWCLEGAILRCYGLEKGSRLIDKIYKDHKIHLFTWNDWPRRTFRQVRALIRQLDI